MFLLYEFRMVVFFSILPFGNSVFGDAVNFTKPKTMIYKHVPVDLVKNLYEKYRDAVNNVSDNNQESMRRLFSKNKAFNIHVKRLKDVNGYKIHNLLINEENTSGIPYIYINNPVEAKFPNPYLTLDEFQHALTNRIKKQKDTLKKINQRLLLLGNKMRTGVKKEVNGRYNKPTRTNSRSRSNDKYTRLSKTKKSNENELKNKQTDQRQQSINEPQETVIPKSTSRNTKTESSVFNKPTINSKIEKLEINRELMKSIVDIPNTAGNSKLEKVNNTDSSIMITKTGMETKVSTLNTTVADLEDTTTVPLEIKESTVNTASSAIATDTTDTQTEDTMTTQTESPQSTKETTNTGLEDTTSSYADVNEGEQVDLHTRRTVSVPTKRTWHTLGRPAVYMG